MGELYEKREARLQMFAQLPDDVIGMVAAFVCPPDCTSDALEYAPNILALGLSDHDAFVATVVRVFRETSTDTGAPLLRMARHFASTEWCLRLYKEVDEMISDTSPKRYMAIAALTQEDIYCEQNRYPENFWRLCDILRHGADAAPTPSVGPLYLATALHWQLWMDASALLARFPDMTVDHTLTLEFIPPALRRKVYDRLASADEILLACKYAVSCDSPAVLSDILACRGAKVDITCIIDHICGAVAQPAMLLVVVEHMHLARTAVERAELLAAILLMIDTPDQDVVDKLVSLGFDKSVLFQKMLGNGHFSRMQPALDTVASADEALFLMQSYNQHSSGGFSRDLDTLEQNQVLIGVAGQLCMLDNFLLCTQDAPPVTLFDRAHSLGLRVHSKARVLAVAVEREWQLLARRIIQVEQPTSAELTSAVFKALRWHSKPSFTLEPLLETGRVDARVLVVLLANGISRAPSYTELARHYARELSTEFSLIVLENEIKSTADPGHVYGDFL